MAAGQSCWRCSQINASAWSSSSTRTASPASAFGMWMLPKTQGRTTAVVNHAENGTEDLLTDLTETSPPQAAGLEPRRLGGLPRGCSQESGVVTGSACLCENAWEDILHLANSIVCERSKLSRSLG